MKIPTIATIRAEERAEEAARLYRQTRLTVAEIAAELGVTARTVARDLHRVGVEPDRLRRGPREP